MDDLIKMCDELQKSKKSESCYSDAITSVRKKLTEYIGDDHNKVLKLKAQLKMHSNYQSADSLGGLTMIVAVITLILTVLKDVSDSISDNISIWYIVFALACLLVLFVVDIIMLVANKKYGYRDRWKRYIEVVLEDMEKINL